MYTDNHLYTQWFDSSEGNRHCSIAGIVTPMSRQLSGLDAMTEDCSWTSGPGSSWVSCEEELKSACSAADAGLFESAAFTAPINFKQKHTHFHISFE